VRLLLSAYACEPERGSEPGVGWNWAMELKALGHDVWVLTRANNQSRIERALESVEDARRPNFLYFDLPPWLRWWKRGGHGVRLYYYLWQIGAIRVARRAHALYRFEAVQHLTFGVFRNPSLMGRLGIPFVLGPLGGGEQTPPGLRRVFPLGRRLIDRLRDIANRVALHDPLVVETYARATCILAKTPDTLARMPRSVHHRARCFLEVGLAPGVIAQSPLQPWSGETFRLLYVGRFIHLKGMALGLRALAELRRKGLPVSLTMVGSGPQESTWKNLASALGVAEHVNWTGWTPQNQLPAVYRSHHALLFPSLHDSSGNAVLEAMAQGLPIVCLDVGGPAAVAGPDAAAIVVTESRSEGEVVHALAETITGLVRSPALHAVKSGNALQRAHGMTWKAVVGRLSQSEFSGNN
jgi:glycosyltransferase involved in cell wall biosynthesis